jgi:predicted naringenin-chalcone synthase
MWRSERAAGTTIEWSRNRPALLAAFGPGLTVDAVELTMTARSAG